MLNLLISFIRVVLTFTRPLSYILFDFIGRILMGKTETLSPICNKILLMSATQLADHIRKKKLTAEDVMKAYINRAKEVNPIVNAYVDERFEEAMADARAVDKMLSAIAMTEQQLANEFPLLGVPFSCKEMLGVKGMTQANGLLLYKDRKSPSDSDVVSELKKAGAIPYIVTNVPTLSMWWETSNLLFGRTLNPYDKRRTVGGSSGGEGAMITTAGSVIGMGTDIGGSIRIPSAFCGIYGHKPTLGIVSNGKPWPLTDKYYDTFSTTGPICRYVQDLKIVLRILSGNNASKLHLDEKVDFSKVKLFYMEEFPGFLLSATSDVKAAVKKAVNHFQDKYRLTPTKLDLKEIQYAFEMWQCKFMEVDGPAIESLKKHMKINWHWEFIKWIFNRSQFDFPLLLFGITEMKNKDSDYFRFLKMFDDLRNKLEDILSEDAVILLPTHPEPAPHLVSTYTKFGNAAYTCIFNILGYPVTNVPAGMSCGVPIGLQAVATAYNDHLTLAVAEELDKVFGGWKSPCAIKV